MASLFEAYITNLGKYNEGALVGETLKFPTTTEEVQGPVSYTHLLQGRYTMPLKANTEKQNERKRCSSLYRTALLPLTAAGEATLTVGKDR